MLKSIVAVVVAVVTWFVVATIGNWILRAPLPGYTTVEANNNPQIKHLWDYFLLSAASPPILVAEDAL